MIRIGTAGWSIPPGYGGAPTEAGSQLERYARLLDAAEINSTFYRSHRASTYARWIASVPSCFRFSVKMPRSISHEARLAVDEGTIRAFVGEAGLLGNHLGPLLVQLPPSLAFQPATAARFFATLRSIFDGNIACEPRHATWFLEEPSALLTECRIARVAADPGRVPQAAVPGGWLGFTYFRLHGSPRMYYSDYSEARLQDWAGCLHATAGNADRWCIFDNTAAGAALPNALGLKVITDAAQDRLFGS